MSNFDLYNDKHFSENEKNKIKLSIINDDSYRFRSYSCKIPDIESMAYCLDFVPKLK